MLLGRASISFMVDVDLAETVARVRLPAER